MKSGKSYWSEYDGYFSKWKSAFADSETRREFKKKMRDASINAMTPLDMRVTNEQTSFFKRRRLTVNINRDDIKEYNKDSVVNKIIELYDKIPFNSDIIDDGIIKYLTTGCNDVVAYASQSTNVSDLLKAIDDYDKGSITYAKLRTHFRKLSTEERSLNIGGDSEGGYKGGRDVGDREDFVDRSLYNKNLRIIQSRVKLRDTINQEENLRHGKRINRNFISGNSYKPLVSRTIEGQKKKKIFFIIDCSGSMGWGDNPKDPSHKAISFAAACVNSGVFDCDHVIYHSDSGWENCIKPIRKGELFNLSGGAEGFEMIDDNLNKEWLRDVDYVIALTDLCIGSDAEQGLADYLKKGKRHLIMSFKNKGTLKGMNVRCITKVSDMINAIVTLVS